ncbi:MAG: PAS domain S-box protein [Deltaproteobacteria bacterium]|nr:PAS domain S-box protein [Deltaproteobacteria bacterium]
MGDSMSAEEMRKRIQDLEREFQRLRADRDAREESERRLLGIFWESPVPTFVIDRDHILTQCNRAFERLTGLPAKDLIGSRDHWKAFYPKKRRLLADFIAEKAPEKDIVTFYGSRCRKSPVAEGAYEIEAFFPRLGEGGKWLLITAVPLKDEGGHVTGAIEILYDITERRQAEEALQDQEKKLTQIVHGSPIPTFVIDRNHVITHCNRAYENLTGLRAEDLIGTRNQWKAFFRKKKPVLGDLIVDRASEEEIAAISRGKIRKSAIAEGAYSIEAFFPDMEEKGRWLFITSAPLRDGEGMITGAVETLQDLTGRKRSEEALRTSERRYRTLLDFIPYPVAVFDLDGRVTYLNPGFTEVFGWGLEELEGKRIPFIPPELRKETIRKMKELFEKKMLLRHETKRLTRDGRILDVSIRAAFYSEFADIPAGIIAIHRDITREKRIARINEAILRISLALPGYPDLEDLLDYVNDEVKRVVGTEGSVIILLDQERQELFVLGASYDDRAAGRRAKETRFPMDQLVAGRVIRSGGPLIVNDTSGEPEFHARRDRKLGYKTRNLALAPLRSHDRINGVLCAINKKEGDFDRTDIDLLDTIAGTVALSIENARVSQELKKAYREVSGMNRAKDKVINHLSHELKTPAAVLSGAIALLKRKLAPLPEDTWAPTMEMIQRNVDRINDIQYEVGDIMEDREYRIYPFFQLILDQVTDELVTLIAQEVADEHLLERVRARIDEVFAPRELVQEKIHLHDFVARRMEALKKDYSRRRIEVVASIKPAPPVFLPKEVLQKVMDGLFRNAVENTPDEGRIEVEVRGEGDGAVLGIRDFGVGILEEDRKRIFEGFFATQETLDYSSKRPYDFNAGGKGADLLRMKIFSERYGFKIDMVSARCSHIPLKRDACPGRISACKPCKGPEDCRRSGGTAFTVYFPPAT